MVGDAVGDPVKLGSGVRVADDCNVGDVSPVGVAFVPEYAVSVGRGATAVDVKDRSIWVDGAETLGFSEVDSGVDANLDL
jgi:hypothetical protein